VLVPDCSYGERRLAQGREKTLAMIIEDRELLRCRSPASGNLKICMPGAAMSFGGAHPSAACSRRLCTRTLLTGWGSAPQLQSLPQVCRSLFFPWVGEVEG